MSFKRIAKGVVIGGAVILVAILSYRWLDTQYRLKYRYSRNSVYEFFYSKICLIRGGVVSNSNELMGTYLTKPHMICGFEYDDSGEECYDSNDCLGTCILKRSKDGMYEGVKGACQRFKSDNWCGLYPGLSVERKDGEIINHNCPIS